MIRTARPVKQHDWHERVRRQKQRRSKVTDQVQERLFAFLSWFRCFSHLKFGHKS